MTALTQPLYVIAADRAAILEQIIEAGGEITEELAARLDASDEALDSKLAACAYMIRNLDAESEKHAAEAKRQAGRAAVLDRAASSLKSYMRQQMDVAGVTKVDGVARLHKNSRPSISWPGLSENIPAQYRRTTYSVNGDAAYLAWKSGLGLPEGFVVEEGSHLRLA